MEITKDFNVTKDFDDEDKKIFCFKIIDDIINEITKNNLSEKYLYKIVKPEDRLINKTYEKMSLKMLKEKNDMNFYHIKVHQQFIYNLCGFHMLFTSLNLVNYIASGYISYLLNVNNSKSFWVFHSRIRKFLWKYSQQNNLTKMTNWKKDWCFDGDLERNFLKAIMYSNEEFISSFCNSYNFKINHFTIMYQAGNFINNFKSLIELQEIIDNFFKIKVSNSNEVIVFYIGACNHWIGFLAHKINNKKEYIYFDSRNKDYLEWNKEEVDRYIEEKSIRHKKRTGKEMLDFFKIAHRQTISDIQDVVKFLIDCLEGKCNFVDYYFKNIFTEKYHRKYRAFFDNLLDLLNENQKYVAIQSIGSSFYVLDSCWSQIEYLVYSNQHLSKDNFKFLQKLLKKYKKLFKFLIKELNSHVWGKRISKRIKKIYENIF